MGCKKRLFNKSQQNEHFIVALVVALACRSRNSVLRGKWWLVILFHWPAMQHDSYCKKWIECVCCPKCRSGLFLKWDLLIQPVFVTIWTKAATDNRLQQFCWGWKWTTCSFLLPPARHENKCCVATSSDIKVITHCIFHVSLGDAEVILLKLHRNIGVHFHWQSLIMCIHSAGVTCIIRPLSSGNSFQCLFILLMLPTKGSRLLSVLHICQIEYLDIKVGNKWVTRTLPGVVTARVSSQRDTLHEFSFFVPFFNSTCSKKIPECSKNADESLENPQRFRGDDGFTAAWW